MNKKEKTGIKCPYSRTISFFSKVILSVQEKIGQIAELQAPYNHRFGIKHLGLRNTRYEKCNFYKKIDINDAYNLYKEGGKITDVKGINNGKDIVTFREGIESEISLFVWAELMNRLDVIDVNSIEGNKNESIKYYANILILELYEVSQKFLENSYQSGEESRLYKLIHLEASLAAKDPTEENNIITKRLYDLIFTTGILNTVTNVSYYVDELSQSKGKDSHDIFKKLIYNSKKNLSHGALTNIQRFYTYSSDKNTSIVLNPETLKMLHIFTKGDFTRMVTKTQRLYGKPESKTYSGCPLLFEKVIIDGKMENGIIAYKLKIAEVLYKFINSKKTTDL